MGRGGEGRGGEGSGEGWGGEGRGGEGRGGEGRGGEGRGYINCLHKALLLLPYCIGRLWSHQSRVRSGYLPAPLRCNHCPPPPSSWGGGEQKGKIE